jgi:hypothetical protein
LCCSSSIQESTFAVHSLRSSFASCGSTGAGATGSGAGFGSATGSGLGADSSTRDAGSWEFALSLSLVPSPRSDPCSARPPQLIHASKSPYVQDRLATDPR